MIRNFVKRAGIAALTLSIAGFAQAAPSDITWTDAVENNPVIANPGFSDNRAYHTHVIFDADAGIWRAWYDAGSGRDVGYAESTDASGLTWGDYTPVVGFETTRQSKVYVLQLEPSLYRMWYMAGDRSGGYQINTALSNDGMDWFDDQPISGMAEDDMTQFGPVERIAIDREADGTFVAYCRTQEPFVNDQTWEWFETRGKLLFRYTSENGVDWTWTGYTGVNDIEELSGFEFQSVVRHPDRDGVWYAFGNNNNSSGPLHSFVSTDGGHTFELDEFIVDVVGDIGTQSYNQDRNYNPSVTYLGGGEWVMFRSTSNPHTTSVAFGVEEIDTPVRNWSIFE